MEENNDIENGQKPIYTNEGEENVLHSSNHDLILPLRIKTFDDEKEFDKFIKTVERLIRSSTEYRLWLSYLINTLGQNTCSFTGENTNECDIEIHHHPITLYTICKGVISKHITNEEEFCSFDIAREVIELHFQNKVGYIPLLSDLHKKYHNGFLPIPIELIHGNFRHLLSEYPFEEDEIQNIYRLCAIKMEHHQQKWTKDSYPGLTISFDKKLLEDANGQ